MGYPVYKLIRAVNRQYPNNGFINYVDVKEDMYRDKEEPYTDIIDEDLRDLINEAIQEVYIHIARDEVFSFPTVPGQKEYSLPEDCDLRDIQEVTRTFYDRRGPLVPPPPIPDGEIYIVSFYPNGGSGYMPSIKVNAGTTIILPTCEFTPPDESMSFFFWRDENGDRFNPGEDVVVYGDMSFTAVWKAGPVDPGRDVTFSINPIEGTFENGEVSVTYEIPQEEAIENCPLVVPNEGYVFTDTWRVGENVYTTDEIEEMAVTENMLIEPILEYNPLGPGTGAGGGDTGTIRTATLSFDANGGTGTMSSIVSQKNSTITLPACTFTGPDGRTFVSWRIDGTTYSAGASYTFPRTGGITAYAQWSAVPVVTPDPEQPGDNGDGGEGSNPLDPGRDPEDDEIPQDPAINDNPLNNGGDDDDDDDTLDDNPLSGGGSSGGSAGGSDGGRDPEDDDDDEGGIEQGGTSGSNPLG